MRASIDAQLSHSPAGMTRPAGIELKPSRQAESWPRGVEAEATFRRRLRELVLAKYGSRDRFYLEHEFSSLAYHSSNQPMLFDLFDHELGLVAGEGCHSGEDFASFQRSSSALIARGFKFAFRADDSKRPASSTPFKLASFVMTSAMN